MAETWTIPVLEVSHACTSRSGRALTFHSSRDTFQLHKRTKLSHVGHTTVIDFVQERLIIDSRTLGITTPVSRSVSPLTAARRPPIVPSTGRRRATSPKGGTGIIHSLSFGCAAIVVAVPASAIHEIVRCHPTRLLGGDTFEFTHQVIHVGHMGRTAALFLRFLLDKLVHRFQSRVGQRETGEKPRLSIPLFVKHLSALVHYAVFALSLAVRSVCRLVRLFLVLWVHREDQSVEVGDERFGEIAQFLEL
jgi:hypothetical protein